MKLHTALLIIPPPEVQAFAAPLRRRYAPDINMQGPAHLTLFYPFVPAGEIHPASMKLRSICDTIAPFELTLDKYDRFESTIFLAPSNPDQILLIYRLLLSYFPDYLPYQGQHGKELIPHLTLAHNDNPEKIRHLSFPPTPSFTFMVDQIHLYLGPAEGNIPWIPVAIIPLAGRERSVC